MKKKGADHPSGRPVREAKVVDRVRWRITPDEPLTPRLRSPACTEAIGFIVERGSDEDKDDD